MLNLYLRNPQTDSGAWLDFPANYQTVQHLFSVLGDALPEIFDTEKSRYELDFLNHRIEGLTDKEKDIFTAALNIEKPRSIMEIVNLSCNLDKFQFGRGYRIPGS